MRTMDQIYALVLRNALACQFARRPQCTCQCKGELHRKPHSGEWLDKTAARLYNEEEEASASGARGATTSEETAA